MVYISVYFMNLPDLHMRAEPFDSLRHERCVRHPIVQINVIYYMYSVIYIMFKLFCTSRGFMGCVRRFVLVGREEVPRPDVSGRGAVDRLLTNRFGTSPFGVPITGAAGILLLKGLATK